MSCASRIFCHSRKIRTTSNIVRHDYMFLVRWFSNEARVSADKGDDILKFQGAGFASPNGCFPGTAGLSDRYRTVFPCVISAVGTQKGKSIMTAWKFGVPMAGLFSNTRTSRSHFQKGRSYSTESGIPPHQEVGMPSLSPTMTEGNIARWLKKEGDKISPGEVLCEVETDKATVEMECMEEGYLAKILKGDGASGIKVGEVIAITVEEEEDVSKFKDYKPDKSDSASPVREPSTPSSPKEEVSREPDTPTEPEVSKPSAPPAADGRIFASPLAKKIAEEYNVLLSNIKGTGPDGVVVKADIEDYLASHAKESPVPQVATAAATSIDYANIPHSQIRKVTASLFLLSKQTIPHYYLTVDTCVDKLMELHSQLNSIQEASGGKGIAVNDLVIKAAALALQKVPQCNSSWTDDYIRQYHNVNINFAVQTDNGAYAPVIRDADKKGLSKIADEVEHLAQKAKDNSLKPEDYEGGTFTVVNLGGPFGIKQFCAIIIPPQAGILAVGSAEKRVVPGSGTDQFKFASFMSVTLSCDHRVIDGAIGAEWLKAFKGYIENPESMLL